MKRYKIRCHDCDPEIVQHDAGKWVRYTDVESLRAELELHKGALIAEQEHVETLEAELAECRAILEKIADPVHAMQRELPEGARLNGAMAVALSNDPNYLKGLAKAGLFDAARNSAGRSACRETGDLRSINV